MRRVPLSFPSGCTSRAKRGTFPYVVADSSAVPNVSTTLPTSCTLPLAPVPSLDPSTSSLISNVDSISCPSTSTLLTSLPSLQLALPSCLNFGPSVLVSNVVPSPPVPSNGDFSHIRPLLCLSSALPHAEPVFDDLPMPATIPGPYLPDSYQYPIPDLITVEPPTVSSQIPSWGVSFDLSQHWQPCTWLPSRLLKRPLYQILRRQPCSWLPSRLL